LGWRIAPDRRSEVGLVNFSPFPLNRAVVVSLFLLSAGFAAAANNPVPTVVAPTIPQAVLPGSGEFTLAVYGANFVSGSVVNWNGQARATTFVSARELQGQILASDIAKATAGYITVTNPPPGGGVSSSSYAIVEVHVPTKTISANQPTAYPVGGIPVAADFTSDGILDLATGTSDAEGQVMLNVGNGDGTFQQAVQIGEHYLNGMIFGDFTGNGALDLVYGWQNAKSGICGDIEPNAPCYLRVLLGDGRGKFHGLPPFDRNDNESGSASGIVVGDLNEDGILDLAVFDSGTIGGVFLGKGDGTFTHTENFYLGGYAVTADFNGDGILDLVVEYGNSLYILIGNGDGTFQKSRRIATDKYMIGSNGPPLLVSDFNNDGISDLAFCDKSYDQTGRIGVLLGKGDGTFRKPTYYSVNNSSQAGLSFTAGDFNSDGNTDLIAATLGVNHEEFEVFWGNGNGTFQKGQEISIPENFSGEGGIVTGDFNSDGLLDFVMADGVLWVYIQK
jgi:hypothetical protein